MDTHYFVIILGILSPILQIMVHIAIIFVSYKAIQALNVYINKNTF